MFGSSGSPPKEDELSDEPRRSDDLASAPGGLTIPDHDGPNDAAAAGPESPVGRKSDDLSNSNNNGNNSNDKRSRRSSGMAKARDMFSGAKNSFLAASPTRPSVSGMTQTPIQKLGRTDPALSVPQGSLNNAAGESAPGPRSTFRVGVTEDKNRKCRRTMEDTHAYLYNFLSTPAPVLDSRKRTSLQESPSNSSAGSNAQNTQPVVETDNGYFAIFDGHAGTFAAEWCGKKLHLLLEDNIRRNPNKAIPELLDETFTSVDQQLEKLPLKNSGCTAVIAVLRWEDRIPNSQSATGSSSIAPATAAAVAKEVPPESVDESNAPNLGAQPSVPSTTVAQDSNSNVPVVEAKMREVASRQRVLYTANVGDARIVLCRNGKALRLSYDHKGSDDNEGKRIANAGGLILNNRVNGVLAVTRALGDAYMKDLVTGHPYTTETVIQPDIDEFLILACDGLWDVCSDQEAVDLVRNTQDPQTASKQLVEHALARFSTDNLSCMIVRFNPQAVADTVAAKAEPIGVEGDSASTVKGGISETEAIVGAAKRNMEPFDNSELSRIDTALAQEQEEQHAGQEPGPELDPDGLAKAREKAREGQVAAGDTDTAPTGESSEDVVHIQLGPISSNTGFPPFLTSETVASDISLKDPRVEDSSEGGSGGRGPAG